MQEFQIEENKNEPIRHGFNILKSSEIHREVKEIGRLGKQYIFFDSIKLLAHCTEFIRDCSDGYEFSEFSEEAIEACDRLNRCFREQRELNHGCVKN